MNPLAELHKKIDESDWDVKQEDLFNKAFQEVNAKLEVIGENELLRKSEAERQTFSFTKTPEKGLSFKVAGTKKLEDGSEIPFEWPDIKEWTEDDYTHIHSRFENCKNVYALTEYGLLLYYSKHLNNNKEVIKLLKALLILAESYYKKSLPNDDKEHYILFFRLVMANAFHIADNRKNDGEIQKVFAELILFSTTVHNTWDIKHKSTLRSVIDLTDFAIEYKNDFRKYKVDLQKYLEQNYAAAKELAKTYNWGAIYICDVSQRLADALGNTDYDWQTFKAEQFEAMVQPNIDTGNHAAVSFVESALAIYRKQKNKKKIAKLSKLYDKVRRELRLGETRQELPKEETQRIFEIVQKEVKEKNSHEIIETICIRPMYAPVDRIKKMAEEIFSENSISKLFPSSILDKYGNKVEVFSTEEEKREHEFWETYGYNFQIGTQTLSHFFFEALKIGKISFESVIEFISSSWIGKTYRVLFNGYPLDVTPLDAVKPGLKLFFDDLEKWKGDNSYPVNFICATDSLVTKTEYLLRFFCGEAGIPTFIDKIKNEHRVKNEKNIDELLHSIKHTLENPTGFLEDHRKFMQFVLVKKMGNNLRHRVAHGLMDAQEYTVTNLILILNIILILSTYKFNPIQNEPDTETMEIAN